MPSKLLRPKSLDEALLELKKQEGKPRVEGGNTTLYEFARQGALTDVETLIDIGPLGLSYVRESENDLIIGAATTLAEIADSSLIRNSPSCFAASECANKITPPQVRNMATIGGAICSAIPFYDMPVALLALGARVKIASLDKGIREVELDNFFVDYFVSMLSPDEMVLEISIPNFANNTSSFAKLGRSSADFSVVNAAARIEYDVRTNRIVRSRIAVGAIGGTPIRAKKSEEILSQCDVEKEVILGASENALSGIDPAPSVHASSRYKQKVAPVLVRDVIVSALRRAGAQIQSFSGE